MSKALKVVVLISGTGRTLKNLLEYVDRGQLSAKVLHVISSRRDAYGLTYARDWGVSSNVIRPKDFASTEKFSEAMTSDILAREPGLVVMAGYNCYYLIPEELYGKVLNIHPALIPKYCGKGFYGEHVHNAVIAAGEKESGCTVQIVDNEYDHGPIVLQKRIPVLSEDTAETLATRVFEQECIAYPEAIQAFAEGRVRVDGDTVSILDKVK